METVRDKACSAVSAVTDMVRARNGDAVNVTVSRVFQKYSISQSSGYMAKLHFL